MSDLAVRFGDNPSTSPSVSRRLETVRQPLMDAAAAVSLSSLSGREQSLALTKLEEAWFWAREAILRQQSSDSD